MALIRMKLLSVSSAIRMVLKGGVGSAPTSSFFGESPGAAFLPLCSVECVSAVVSWLSSSFFSASVLLVDSSGRTKVNVVPLPTSEVTDMLPPRRSMMVLQIESPNPVPWAKLFTLTKRSNTRSTLSGAMPIPVSVTWNATYLPSRRYP